MKYDLEDLVAGNFFNVVHDSSVDRTFASFEPTQDFVKDAFARFEAERDRETDKWAKKG